MRASRKKSSGKTGQNVGVGPDMGRILPSGTVDIYLSEDYMTSLATCALFLKQSYADQIGIPVDVWKDCFNSLWCGGFQGNNIQWSAVSKIIGKYTALHDLKENTQEILRKFETLASPFIRTAKRWLSLIEETIVPELLHCNEQKKQCIKNAVGNVFILSDEEQKSISEYLSEIAAFLLQGMESNYIFHLMILAHQYGYRILSNEHDGIVIESMTSVGLVDEIQEKAKIESGLEQYELFPRLKETIYSQK